MTQNFYVGTGMPDYDHRTEEQEDLDKKNRRATLVRVLCSAKMQEHPAADLVLLVDALGLGDELHELTRRSAERQRLLADVRRDLEQLSGRPAPQPGE